MGKNESLVHGTEKKDIFLTEGQQRTNPGGFWQDFFDENRRALFVHLATYPDPDAPIIHETMQKAIQGLKKAKKDNLVSEDELLRRGLEYYRDHEDPKTKPFLGFGKAKGLEEKYEELCHSAEVEKKNASEERATQAFQKMIEPEDDKEGLDFDNANGPIEALVAQVVEDAHPSEEEVSAFRTKLWNMLTEKCMSR
jgi:hypothetical protein